MHFRKSLFCSLFLLSASATVAAGSVTSMTAEQEVAGPGGELYLQSYVDCAASGEDRPIWRKASGGDWCATLVPELCSSRKIRAAKKACGREYARLVEEAAAGAEKPAPASAPELVKEPESKPAAAIAPAPATPAPAAAPAQVAQGAEATAGAPKLDEQQRQLEIERERLKIEQQRLELRKQQVELQKQELEIKRELEAEEEGPAEEPRSARSQPARQESKSSGSGPGKSVLGM